MVKPYLKTFTSASESIVFLLGGRCERCFLSCNKGSCKKISGDKNPAHWCIVFLSPLFFYTFRPFYRVWKLSIRIVVSRLVSHLFQAFEVSDDFQIVMVGAGIELVPNVAHNHSTSKSVVFYFEYIVGSNTS